MNHLIIPPCVIINIFLLGKFFNVPANQIAVTTSASAGVASLASALDFTGKRNKVVTTDNEFPTIGQIWHAQEKRGAKVIHVPSKEDLTVIPNPPNQQFIDTTSDQNIALKKDTTQAKKKISKNPNPDLNGKGIGISIGEKRLI